MIPGFSGAILIGLIFLWREYLFSQDVLSFGRILKWCSYSSSFPQDLPTCLGRRPVYPPLFLLLTCFDWYYCSSWFFFSPVSMIFLPLWFPASLSRAYGSIQSHQVQTSWAPHRATIPDGVTLPTPVPAEMCSWSSPLCPFVWPLHKSKLIFSTCNSYTCVLWTG